MATQVLIAHTGQRLEVDITQFSSLDDLKSWVARNSAVSLQHIVVLTPQGRSVKLANLHTEKEIYVYDIRVTQPSAGSASSLISEASLPRRQSIPNAPNSIDDIQAITSWQELCKERRNWATRIMEDCDQLNAAAQARYDEIDVMIRCLDAAVTNVEISVKQIEPKYNELKKWVTPALSEHEQLVSSWDRYLDLARSIPISSGLVKFMTRGQVNKADPTLEDLIELETANKAGKLAPTAHRRFSQKASELDGAATQMYQGTDSSQLMEDIEAVAKQIDSDYRTALNYGNSQRDLAQASKTASIHTERLVPTLRKRAKEMDEMAQYATQARNAIAADSVSFMRNITEITSLHSSVRNQINVLNQSEDDMTTFDYLRLIQQLPYMYASFMVEAIRRREWIDKVKADSSTLANEMALFQDEESKRRKKWQKMVGSMYGPGLDTNVMGLEVNLRGEDIPWPSIGKPELEEFLQLLQERNTDQEIVNDVAKLLQELSAPTKQQTKRLKAFKNGSVHEAALGRSGLLIRGDDDLIGSLQDEKLRLENKLKTADSRLSQRIAQLENELREEKKRSADFQKDLDNRVNERDDMRDRIEEVNSTKKDLLENMEALKREFLDERISLENEIKTLKARLEDTEEEMDHFGESRENEKANFDEKIQALEAEIERANKERKDDMLKSQGQVEFLRKETQMQRDQLDASERRLRSVREEARLTSKKLESVEENKAMPTDEADLTEALISNAADIVEKVRNSGSTASLLRSELDKATNSAKELRAELTQMKENLSSQEMSTMHARENLAEEKAKVTALEREVTESREELNQLRSQLSDGETGSEMLRKKLEKEEKKVTELSEEVAWRQSQVGSLEEESRLFKQRFEDVQSKLSALSAQYEARDGRTKDLTQRLYSQNDRLTRLLERVGYSISRDAGQMVITRVSRSDKLAVNPNDSSDPGSSLRRSLSLGGRAMTDSSDLELLYWVSNADPTVEDEKYQAFMEKLGTFDTDLFSDTIYHRVKEAEHKARKWQREARSYRDRAHSLQKDSHNKIAFRNFKEGDLALFLPTRNQQAGAWAAFNVGFPHYFLREQDGHRLRHREWLVARISKIQERVVDLSKSLQPSNETDSNDEENDNPFQLSDGLRWYLIDAQEDKIGAPTTPGMGKSTVAANNVEATANIQSHAAKGKGRSRDSIASIEGINKTLSKSLESRRSSSGSKKALPFHISGGTAHLKNNSALASETNSLRAAPPDTPTATSPVQGSVLSAANTDGGQRGGEPSAQDKSGKAPEVRAVDSLLGP
ncbi:autophagy-related protein [Trichoderma breve]|uniref:Autophagy-related protein 11 n=1 Tax=Trichoderma breve TaxID=2034170 RepID=A0A9W9E9U2_9HYPO|nr:autophagy-related protein [Trichoderma breve]KAJ4860586.1 autophagy-related protein [Trichoderma breve]